MVSLKQFERCMLKFNTNFAHSIFMKHRIGIRRLQNEIHPVFHKLQKPVPVTISGGQDRKWQGYNVNLKFVLNLLSVKNEIGNIPYKLSGTDRKSELSLRRLFTNISPKSVDRMELNVRENLGRQVFGGYAVIKRGTYSKKTDSGYYDEKEDIPERHPNRAIQGDLTLKGSNNKPNYYNKELDKQSQIEMFSYIIRKRIVNIPVYQVKTDILDKLTVINTYFRNKSQKNIIPLGKFHYDNSMSMNSETLTIKNDLETGQRKYRYIHASKGITQNPQGLNDTTQRNDEHVSGYRISSVKHAPVNSDTSQDQTDRKMNFQMSDAEIRQLTDKVYYDIEQRLKKERERLGL